MSANLMSKWRLDLNSSARSTLSKSTDSDLNPPGYFSSFVASQKVDQTTRNDHNQQQHLLSKRAWDMALQPMKSLPMNVFMMYMAGNTISIFPIMMIAMMVWRPMKAIMAVNAEFKSLQAEYAGSLLGHKILFVLGNLGAIALAIYKCHSMGLLPNHASDWLDFKEPPERMQYLMFSS